MKKVLQLFTCVLFVTMFLSVFMLSCKKQNIDQSANSGNNVNGRGDVGGSDDGAFVGCAPCQLAYPNNNHLPRSAEAFNENTVMVASDPSPALGTCAGTPDYIRVWYSDEHALTLGVRQVIVKTKSGSTVTNYPIEPTPSSPTSVRNPKVGATAQTGDQTGNDVASDGGRPLWPALFITDITYDTTARSGDWQYGGTAVPPTDIFGTWKSAVRTVDKTQNPVLVTVTPDADPAKNNWNLGLGTAPPAGVANEGYGALVQWKVSDLNLQSGHRYRIQFMVHDGDQNKAGGDVGEACTTIIIKRGSFQPE